MAIQWNPALALGHAEIDDQHRELFRRFGALVAAMATGERAEIGVLFDFLGEYVVLHFSAEEKVMRDTAYPGATVHKAAHDRFVREYGELRRLYEANGPVHGIVVKTRTWIEHWLESHIAEFDRALARHLRSEGGLALTSAAVGLRSAQRRPPA